jgi:hypothetical protein
MVKASRALVVIAPADREARATATASRPNADFLAHLIATAAKVPQTRARRRAEPNEAIAAYDALGQWPMPLGRALSRSL